MKRHAFRVLAAAAAFAALVTGLFLYIMVRENPQYEVIGPDGAWDVSYLVQSAAIDFASTFLAATLLLTPAYTAAVLFWRFIKRARQGSLQAN